MCLQVRTRTQDLQKTLLQAIFDLETAPERYDWSAVSLNCLLVVSADAVVTCALCVIVVHGHISSTCWAMLCRSNVLERFAVMNSQLHAVTAQIVPLLEHYVVHPRVSNKHVSHARRQHLQSNHIMCTELQCMMCESALVYYQATSSTLHS